MGKITMPMGIMDATISDVKVSDNVLTIIADVGAAPNYIGKVEVELSPSDFGGNLVAIAVWVIRKVFPRMFLQVIRRK